LRELAADVIALQEVGYGAGARPQELEQFADTMHWRLIKGVTLEDEAGHYGNALLTRLPVSSVCRHDLSVPGREPRGAIDVQLDCQGLAVQVIATHLGLRPAERRSQVQALLSLVDTHGAQVTILLGDLNEWFLFGRPLRRLHKAFGSSPGPATFPAWRPMFALDRLWIRPRSALCTLRAHRSALSRQASDHLPLVAELDLENRI
jgi:endonuclease/exonuclease/phosphatase family metal-dependent hydrolase